MPIRIYNLINKLVYYSRRTLINQFFSKLIITINIKLQISAVSLTLLLFLSGYTCYSQDSFRRHFIIAYDISNNFRNLQQKTPRLQRDLEDLFNNFRVDNPNGNANSLLAERQIKKQFFDPDKDEISFFQFNIPQSVKVSLIRSQTRDSTKTVRDFSDALFRNTNISWSGFRKERGPNVIAYMFNTFNSTFVPSDNSTPNFVYPLILNKIDSKKPAEEYILMVLTLRSPLQYTSDDLNYLNNIYQSPPLSFANASLSVGYIKNVMNNLMLCFDKTDYFNYSYNIIPGNINSSIGIFGFFLTPKNVAPSTAASAIKIEDELKLSQAGYLKNEFKLSSLEFNFPNNKLLIPTNFILTVTDDIDRNDTIFKMNILAQIDDGGHWHSNYSNKKNILRFNKSNSSYTISGLKISLNGINSQKDSRALRLYFEVKTQYRPTNINTINYVFYSESVIPSQNIHFIGFGQNAMYYVIPAIVLLVLILILINFGKPRGLNFRVNGYLDSILLIDYKKFGQLHTPYKYWNEPDDFLVVDGIVSHYSANYMFNWKPNIILNIQELTIPQGFSVFLKPDNKTLKEYTKGNPMGIKQTKGHNLKFLIGIRQNDINVKIAEPQLFKIRINALIRNSVFLVQSEIREILEYNFHIGNDLGDVWVGLDPGTTGSCIAVGTESENIVLGRSNKKYGNSSTIIPSKIIFDTTMKPENVDGEISEDIYKYGVLANFGWDIAKVKFQSFKKLLGYRDIKKIEFANNKKLELSGKKLSGLLVKGLYNELSAYLEGESNIEFNRKNNGTIVFNPKRAVVAIPNNSTISKIQDIIDCVGYMKQFKEIRYVYEAEAVLFYYLSYYNRFNTTEGSFKNETILVFDMGGSTINATVVNVTKKEDNKNNLYSINFLGKIGYAIGGDTIDYCLIKFILSFSKDFPELKAINIDNNKDQLAKLAQLIKHELSDNFKKGFDYLITFANLQKYINEQLNIKLLIEETSNIYKYFKKDQNGNFKLLTHSFFIDIIYNNVKDAIVDVLEMSGNIKIDKVIFSGRSTSFPYIRETVEKQLDAKNTTAEKIILDLEESKTAVALGACWYGINKNSIKLNNLKTYASFGVKRTIGPAMKNVEFIELLQSGCSFDSNNSGIGYVENKKQISENFALDGAKVNFYQVMGKNASKILSDNQKHKFSRIASINVPLETISLEINVSENDEVTCKVELINNKKVTEKGEVSDQDITEANEKHYTWILD